MLLLLLLLCLSVLGCGSATPKSKWDSAAEATENENVRVSVALAQVGKIVLRDGGNKRLSDEPYLQVHLVIENVSQGKKIDYIGWGAGIVSGVRMKDDLGNSYSMQFDALSLGTLGPRVEDRIIGDSIYPGKSVADMLVFEVPVSAASELKLSLPATCIGEEGTLRLKIAADKVRTQKAPSGD